MKTTNPNVRHATVAGHQVRSVVSHDEAERHYARALADLGEALPYPEQFEAVGANLTCVVTTPDFHPGKPVPVGVVADIEGAVCPHLIGNDIGCGMRMIALDGITADDLMSRNFDAHLRHVFFQGGRDIGLTGRDRHAILREGIPGLLSSVSDGREGLLGKLDFDAAWIDADRAADGGFFACTDVDPDFADYAKVDGTLRRDAILGTIGGGNHFVEIGVVDMVVDSVFASAAGIRRGALVIVVHSGSLDFGQRVGTAARERMQCAGQTCGDRRIVEIDRSDHFSRYIDGHANAANAAFANRLLIGLATVEAIEKTVGRRIEHHLVYDAPHNTVWTYGTKVRHRKGACPARGPEDMVGTPYAWLGEPVILPGSMGDGTWLLKGLGSGDGLSSSAHGAGRKLSRGQARVAGEMPSNLRVVGPIDPDSAMMRGRADIRSEVLARLKEEAPAAYRPIDSVVDPMVDAGLVGRVAKIRPMLTIKG
jgi:tRNA-splicing ligase RtcB (3'-phosphate/5'-hydroxy nucleic acid ligase)